MAKTKKKHSIRKGVEKLIFFIAIAVFIYAGFNLFTIWKANNDEKVEIERIRESVNVPTTENELDNFSVDFDKLKSINPDIVGWIVVLDTSISYPVVKGQDNEYYLNRTFEKKENYAGSIFMDYRNNADLSDYNTFIYGHNVYHGTMFAELENYSDEDFFKKHPYIYYYTPSGSYKLQIFSSYIALGDSPSYRIDFTDNNEYQNYLNYVNGLSKFESGVEVNSNDKIITLYTCSYESGNNPTNSSSEYIDDRYFIHGKIIKTLE